MNIAALVLCLSVGQPATSDPSAEAALERFARAWGALRSATYRMVKQERLRDGRTVHEEVAVKLRKPFAVYLAARKPRVGQEVIYDVARDAGQLVVHPGRFPDLTLRLDIHGSLATKDQHHPITHAGFEYTLRNVQRAVATARASPRGERFEHRGTGTFAGRRVEIIVLHAGARPARRERARAGESLFAFADRVGADAYAIFYVNPSIDALAAELDGAEYVVPAYYGQRIELKLGAEHGLPVQQSVWDAQGNLYERYEYLEMRVNPPLTDADFDPENPAYGF